MAGRHTWTNDDRYKFTGHELDTDADLDLSYAGARYLDSEIGSWLSIDPLADQYPGWSPYNYTMGNPINLVDPDGKAATSCCKGVGAFNSLINTMINARALAGDKKAQEAVKIRTGIQVGIVSTVLPGPEDLAFGALMLTKTGQALGRLGGRIGGAVSGLFRSGDEVADASKLDNLIPDGKEANHIFSGKKGKFSDTIENREFIQGIANDKNNLVGVDEYGKEWYSFTKEDGSQVYVYTQKGKVKGAGINEKPIDLKNNLNLEN